MALFRSRLKNAARRTLLNLEYLEDRTVPTLLGQQLFPSDNPWNQQITNAPVASNSAAIMNNIVTTYGNGRLHPDYGQDYLNSNDLYGIPYNVVHGNSVPKVQVVIDGYPGESDLQNAPIISGVVIEGDLQNGPKVGVDNRGDSHLIVWDQDNNIDYEFYRASRPSENTDGKWHADQETIWDMKANTFRTIGWTSADAAGLAILPGLVRPDEGLPANQGGQGSINHAIRFTLQNSVILNQFLYPASHVANAGNNNPAVQPPMGARFRLKASVDISQFGPEARIVAQAMKDYGMIVADNGSNFYFSGASYAVNANNQYSSTWDDNDIQDSLHGLKALHYSDFEVVDLTPIVTGLSATSGAAGDTITVTGQNFSGAAGRLTVTFGAVASPSVTYVDDAHLQVRVPSGTGTVDVRVQSGVTTAANSQNIKNTIFGYGISPTSTADRFTFGATVNQPPTVASNVTVSANPIVGSPTTLNVLGADDGGASNLTYTWTVSGPAAVTFTANGTNAARNTTASFTQSGIYYFTVTIRDAAGLSVATGAIVTVASSTNQAPTIASNVTVSANPVVGTPTSLSVLGADDGGAANLTYTWTVSGPAAVTFSANGTNAARNTTASFTQSGTYYITVTIRDAAGLSVATGAIVTVAASTSNQPPTIASNVSVSANPIVGTPTTLSVLGADDGGATNLTYTWTVSGPAAVTFSANGANAARNTTATFTQAGTYYITVTIRDAAGLSVATGAIVTVATSTSNQAPTIASNVTVSQNPVTANTTILNVLGADDGGAANLTYTWTISGPAAVTLSANGTNAARTTTATFTQSGIYYFTVTIRDVAGLGVATGAIITVN
ncbi:MAG TPA: PKD domain-containing protein [Gemmataceae bacterium]|nr:PKD domain-containing protein [Gemmataceae bacterium]